MKRTLFKIMTVAAVMAIVAAPSLLFFDLERFAPLVLVIWLVSVLAFVFARRVQ
jgi:hypothetical protein